MSGDTPNSSSVWNKLDPDLVVCAALLVLIFGIYGQTFFYEFVSFDDPLYVTENQVVRQGLTRDGFVHSLTAVTSSNWQPVTLWSHMLDVELFGLRAGPHHAVNVMFHLLNSILVYFVLQRLTRNTWPAAAVAFLFAVHPQHVESVAWISERKDVLSTMFWLLAMWAYAWYAERPRIVAYGVLALLFTLGLAAKPMLVTLPFALLLLDYWPLRRLPTLTMEDLRAHAPRLVLEKAPLFVLAAGMAALSLYSQSETGSVASMEMFSSQARMSNAVVSYATYAWKTIAPYGLALLYAHPGESVSLLKVLVSFSLLAFVTLLAIVTARSRPYFLVGWLWFCGTLVPVIGLVQVGQAGMADRYMYVPHIGLFIAAAWGLADEVQSNPRLRTGAVALVCVVVGAYSLLCWNQVGYWRNTVTLFQRALAITPDSAKINYNLGIGYAMKGDHGRAKEHFEAAIERVPRYMTARRNLAVSLVNVGDYEEARIQLRELIGQDPYDVRTHVDLAVLLYRMGRYKDAILRAEEALRIEDEHARAQGVIDECRKALEPTVALP